MRKILIYPAISSPASHVAVKLLAGQGVEIADHVTPEATHLLLDAPSMAAPDRLRSGASLSQLLSFLPSKICVIGGFLPTDVCKNHPCIDLLKDETYLHENAALTAECAVSIAAEKAKFALRRTPVLIIGWGRIGRQLAHLLRGYHAEVCILSGTDLHRAEASASGFGTLPPDELPRKIGKFRILFNTAPSLMIPKALAEQCTGALKIDLASSAGFEAEDAIIARGLPGLRVPESAGALIAKTILEKLRREA